MHFDKKWHQKFCLPTLFSIKFSLTVQEQKNSSLIYLAKYFPRTNCSPVFSPLSLVPHTVSLSYCNIVEYQLHIVLETGTPAYSYTNTLYLTDNTSPFCCLSQFSLPSPSHSLSPSFSLAHSYFILFFFHVHKAQSQLSTLLFFTD